jgi:hypothetical protein
MAVTMADKQNYFDEIREGEPKTIVVGDYLQWKKSDIAEVYDPTLYTLSYIARIAGGGNEINITATDGGGYFLIQESSTVTSTYNPGYYHWQLEVTRNSDSERIVIDRGFAEVIADLDINASDPRSHSEIMLDKIESLLEGKADADVSSYSIAGRSLTKLTFTELIDAEKYFRKKVVSEKAKLDAENHRETQATIKVRF